MKFRPLHDRVLVRRIEPLAQSAGGIFIPDTAQEKPMEGEVIAVGSGARSTDGTIHPLEVNAGDCVLFARPRRALDSTSRCLPDSDDGSRSRMFG